MEDIYLMSEKSYDIFVDDEAEKIAKDIAKLSIDEQRKAVTKIYSESVSNLLRVVIATIKIIKTSDNDLVKNNNAFLALCDKGVSTLQSIIDEGKITKQKQKMAADCMIEILKKTNHPDSLIVSKIFEDVKLAGLTVLGLIATIIQTHC